MRIILERDKMDESGGYFGKKTVSDWVTPEEVRTWEPGEVIAIQADTGVGKSFFVMHTLLDYLCEKNLTCLYLVSRTRLKEQLESEMPKICPITFATYQSIECKSINLKSDFKNWDIIVADECHYFILDSAFNNKTDISLDWIFGQKTAIKIFMTATFDGMERYFYRHGIEHTGYVIPIKNRRIEKLDFFWGENQLVNIADQVITDGSKGVFFIQSAERAYNLHRLYKENSIFICSESNRKYARFMDKSAVAMVIQKERFDTPLLISTMVLDVGVNLKDREIRNIIVDVPEPTSVIQCIGRKRFLDEKDSINLYVRTITNQQISGMLRKLEMQKAKKINKFFDEGAIVYNAENDRGNDNLGFVFDSPEFDGDKVTFSKQVNKPRLARLEQQLSICKEMLSLGNFGFTKFIAKALEIESYNVLEDEKRKQDLTDYLKSIVGQPILTREERKPLIEKMNIRQDGHLQKGYSVLAAWLESSGLPYRLHEHSIYTTVDGKRKHYRAWEVVKLVSGSD